MELIDSFSSEELSLWMQQVSAQKRLNPSSDATFMKAATLRYPRIAYQADRGRLVRWSYVNSSLPHVWERIA